MANNHCTITVSRGSNRGEDSVCGGDIAERCDFCNIEVCEDHITHCAGCDRPVCTCEITEEGLCPECFEI